MRNDTLQQTMTLREALGSFRRQRVPMLVIFFLCLAVGVCTIVLSKKWYRCQTEILVEGKTPNSTGEDPTDPVTEVSLPNQDADVLTQIEVLQSEKLLTDCFRAANVKPPPEDLPPQVRKSLMPVIKVEEDGTTNVLLVNVDTLSQEDSEKLAAVIPLVYNKYVKATKQVAVDNALSFLTLHLADEEKALSKAEKDLEAYKRKRTLLPFEDEGRQRSAIVATSQADVARAFADYSAAQERLKSLEADRAKLPPMLVSPNTEANTAAIEAQKTAIASLKAQRNSLLATYLPTSREVKKIDEEIATEVQRLDEMPKVQDTSTKTVNPEIITANDRIMDARSQLKATKETYDKLAASAAKSESGLREYHAIEPEQGVLEREVEDRKNAVDAINHSLEVLQVRRNSASDPVTVLAPVSPPEKVRPRTLLYMALATLAGGFLSVGFAIVKDGLDDKVTSSDEIYGLTGLPPVGDIPALPRRSRSLTKSGFNDKSIESYRILRFNLLFSTLNDPTKSIVVTSAGSAEGKTELACNLAVAASGEGRRVILVDANLRNPTIHKKMNVEGKPGLTDIVLGQALLEESLHHTSIPGLYVLTCGSPVFSPAELLASPEMHEIYEQLIDTADLVIFDTPGCLNCADALVLSNVGGAVLFVAKSGSTKRNSVRRGIESLKQGNARVLGVALSGSAVS